MGSWALELVTRWLDQYTVFQWTVSNLFEGSIYGPTYEI